MHIYTCILSATIKRTGTFASAIMDKMELQLTFTGMLIRFYESNEMGEIKQFLYENV